jgi:hypothetical protein
VTGGARRAIRGPAPAADRAAAADGALLAILSSSRPRGSMCARVASPHSPIGKAITQTETRIAYPMPRRIAVQRAERFSRAERVAHSSPRAERRR